MIQVSYKFFVARNSFRDLFENTSRKLAIGAKLARSRFAVIPRTVADEDQHH